MSLLCRLGRHKPRGIPRWNDGLYFSTCARCGRDLVRTAYQGWHVPTGYRVVWSDRPPVERPEVALVRSTMPQVPGAAVQEAGSAPVSAASPPEPAPVPAPSVAVPPEPGPEPSVRPISVDDDPPAQTSVPAGGSPGGRLPIQDVLAHLKAQEDEERARETAPAATELPPPPPPPSPSQASAPKRRSTWDFMDDEPLEHGPLAGPERTRAPEGTLAAAAPPVDREAQPVSRKAGGLPAWWRSVRPAVRNFFSGPAEPRPTVVAGLALAVAVAVALGLYWAGYPTPGSPSGPPGISTGSGGGSETPDSGEKPDPFATSASLDSPGQAQPRTAGREAFDEVAFVSASLLVCREAPVQGARRVRNLVRGREVRVLGYDGAWASLAYRGGQCWAQAQYLSPVPPL